MGHQNHRLSLLLYQLPEKVHNQQRILLVQGARGFVCQDNLLVADLTTGNLEAVD